MNLNDSLKVVGSATLLAILVFFILVLTGILQ